jgi:hypothetical protein
MLKHFLIPRAKSVSPSWAGGSGVSDVATISDGPTAAPGVSVALCLFVASISTRLKPETLLRLPHLSTRKICSDQWRLGECLYGVAC